jgi:Ca2+/H+ antiporter, TMEM165/GDT1 family
MNGGFKMSQLIIFSISVLAVTLAEMGDKTQLLAMAFATRFSSMKVMIGVFIATVLNHAFAVAIGTYITKFSSIEGWIQLVAAISFIFFGLWTIRGDKLEGEDKVPNRYGAIMTVAIAFFIAELGDKTQLTTIALSAKYPESPVWVLMGTTTGMIIADAIGIAVGVVMCRKIPERTVKLVSAGAFMIFGVIGLYGVLASKFSLGSALSAVLVGVAIAATGIAAYAIIRKHPIEDANLANGYCAVRSLENQGKE